MRGRERIALRTTWTTLASGTALHVEGSDVMCGEEEAALTGGILRGDLGLVIAGIGAAGGAPCDLRVSSGETHFEVQRMYESTWLL